MTWHRSPAAGGLPAALHYGDPGRTARYCLLPLGPIWRVGCSGEELDHVTDDLGAWCRERRIAEPLADDVAWIRGGT